MRGWLLLTMAMWGLNLTIVKVLLPVFGPQGVSSLRMVAASALLIAIVIANAVRGARPWPALSLRQWLGLLVCGAWMVGLNQVLFVEGVVRTSATNAALIIALNPLLSSLLAALTLRERFTLQRLIGVVMGFGGVALVILHRPGAGLGYGSLGDLLALGSVATWVSGGVMVHRLVRTGDEGIDTNIVSAIVYPVGAVLLLGYALIGGAPIVAEPARVTWPLVVLLVFSGLTATGLGALVWNRALVTLGMARTALYAYWVPIFGVAFAVLLLGEPLTVWHLLGLALVLGGTWFGTRGV
ncbi:MAG: DMT family transporter [Burkholderiales bacterium]|nr:DMT family transporter [Burkholderiales bacterium]